MHLGQQPQPQHSCQCDRSREIAKCCVMAMSYAALFRSRRGKTRGPRRALNRLRASLSSHRDAAVATVLLRSHTNESRKEAVMNRVWSHAIVAAALAASSV